MPYDLDDATLRRRCAAALATHPSTGRFVALAVAPGDPMADLARTVERTVFEESFGTDAATMTREYGPYEHASIFFLVIDRSTGLPAGAARVIDGGGKTLDDAPDRIGRDLSDIARVHELHDGKIWDFATLAVLPAYRGGRSALTVSSLLYRTFLKAGHRAGVRHVVCLLDHRAYRNLQLLGAPLVTMAGSAPFEYPGSPKTRALYVRFADLEPGIADQATRLGRFGATHAGTIKARGIRRLITRRVAARISTQVSSGDGLDEHITLPGLERRRLAHRR